MKLYFSYNKVLILPGGLGISGVFKNSFLETPEKINNKI